jgi:tRNA pseudouridine38-40 synthase
MLRYAIELAYNGTNFHGWQKQLNAISVQQELEEKLSLLLRNPIETLGCGRTDTGVHARQFIAHFDFIEKIDCGSICNKLNKIISNDIVCYKIWEVPISFNARFDAKWRTYEYVITPIANPFIIDYAWRFSLELDLILMNKACDILLANTNFECFSKVHTDVANFNCKVAYAKWEKKEELLIFTIKANRFLRNMVRAVVGTLIEVGLEKITLNEFRLIIDSKNRSNAGVSVPAKGLFLTKVEY